MVDLAEDSMAAIDHRVGRRPLFGEMNHRLRFKRLHDFRQEFIIENVANKRFDLATSKALPRAKSLGQRTDERQCLCAEFVVPGAALEVVNDRDFIATARKI